MITAPEPRELASQTIKVSSGAGSKVFNISGYLDALIVDAPASETFKLYIKGPSGVEYYLTPNLLTGDNTIIFSPALPMTGKMTFGIQNASGDGDFPITPIGNLKGV